MKLKEIAKQLEIALERSETILKVLECKADGKNTIHISLIDAIDAHDGIENAMRFACEEDTEEDARIDYAFQGVESFICFILNGLGLDVTTDIDAYSISDNIININGGIVINNYK